MRQDYQRTKDKWVVDDVNHFNEYSKPRHKIKIPKKLVTIVLIIVIIAVAGYFITNWVAAKNQHRDNSTTVKINLPINTNK